MPRNIPTDTICDIVNNIPEYALIFGDSQGDVDVDVANLRYDKVNSRLELENLTVNNSVSLGGTNGITYIPGSDVDVDLLTVNVTGAPRFWWNEAADSFEMNKSLTVPGGSLRVGTHILSENTETGDDGFEVIGTFHIEKHPDGMAGSIEFHEGTEPVAPAMADAHRFWVDTDHNIQWQNQDGTSRMLHAAGGNAPGQWLVDDTDIYYTAGNVGIGKIPTVALDVDGTIAATDGNSTNWNTSYGWGDHSLAGYLTSYTETDPVFSAWDKSTGISITESQISDLTHTPSFDGDITEIYNSSGDLKIMPDVQGDVILFGDTNIGNGDTGKELRIWRKASEGNEYIRFYISATQKGFIHTSCPLTLQAQVDFTINSVTEDIIFKVGDNAGAKKVYFKDSDGNTQMQVDSDGEAFIRTDLWFSNILGDKISLYDKRKDTTGMYGFGVESNALYSKSPANHRWYINANADGGTSSIMELTSTGLGIRTSNPNSPVHIVQDMENLLQLTRDNDTEDGTVASGILFGVRSVPSGLTLQNKGAILFKRTAGYGRGDLVFAVNGGANNNNASLGDAVLSVSATAIDVSGNITVSGTVDGIDIDVLNTAVNLKAPLASPTFTGDVTMPGTGIWKSDGWVGIGTITPGLPLEVRLDNGQQAIFFDSTAQAAGVGGGIAFGGKYTDAGAEAMAGRIGTQKTNSTSGHVGFDMVFKTQDFEGSITERMILTSDGLCGLHVPTISSPTKPLDVWGDTRLRGNLNVDVSLIVDNQITVTNIESSGNIVAGGGSSNFRISAYINRTTGIVRSARFQTDGNHVDARGISIWAGEDTESGTNYWLEAYDGDGGILTGGLRSVAGVFDVFNACDERLKQNIEDTKIDAKSIINGLRVRDFELKRNPGYKVTDFIAQEALVIYPNAVGAPDSETGMYGMSKTALIPPLVKCIQELEKRVRILERR